MSIQVWHVFDFREVAFFLFFLFNHKHIISWICCQAIVVLCEHDVLPQNDSALLFMPLFFPSHYPTTTVPQEQQSDAVRQHH